MFHLVSIVFWCATLFTTTHSHCHPRVYEYDQKTGEKKGKDPIKYEAYQIRVKDCLKLSKVDCSTSLKCLWREHGAVFPIESPSINKLIARVPKVMSKQEVVKYKAGGPMKGPTEQQAQSLKPAKSFISIGTDGVLYDIEYTDLNELTKEGVFYLMHPKVVEEFHTALTTLIKQFVAKQKQDPEKQINKLEVVSEFQKQALKSIKSDELQQYKAEDWGQYIQYFEEEQKRLASTSKTPKRRLLDWDAVGDQARGGAPYSSFGLIGIFDENNNLLSAAGGSIIRIYNGYDNGRCMWVYVAAAAHDIIVYKYKSIILENGQEDFVPEIRLMASLDKFKFYPGFSGNDEARKNNHNTDQWQLHEVFIWPQYINSYLNTEVPGGPANDLAIFQFKVTNNQQMRWLRQHKPNPMAELFVRNQVPQQMHMTGYDITKQEQQNQVSYTYTMKHSAIPAVDCSKENGEMCEYGGENGMALKPGYCGGPIFDENNPQRIVAIQATINNAPVDGNCGPNGGPKCIGKASKITAGKKQGVDWIVGDVIVPERVNMFLDVVPQQHDVMMARKQHRNMYHKFKAYDGKEDDHEEAMQYGYDDMVDNDGYKVQDNKDNYVMNGDSDRYPSYVSYGMSLFAVMCVMGCMLVIGCLALFGCFSVGGVVGYWGNYVLSSGHKDEMDDVYVTQSDV